MHSQAGRGDLTYRSDMCSAVQFLGPQATKEPKYIKSCKKPVEFLGPNNKHDALGWGGSGKEGKGNYLQCSKSKKDGENNLVKTITYDLPMFQYPETQRFQAAK